MLDTSNVFEPRDFGNTNFDFDKTIDVDALISEIDEKIAECDRYDAMVERNESAVKDMIELFESLNPTVSQKSKFLRLGYENINYLYDTLKDNGVKNDQLVELNLQKNKWNYYYGNRVISAEELREIRKTNLERMLQDIEEKLREIEAEEQAEKEGK